MADLYDDFDKNLYKTQEAVVLPVEISPENIAPGSLLSDVDYNVGGIETGKDVNTAGVASAVEPNDIVFWAGATKENRENAPFRVTADGDVFASSVTIDGVVLESQGVFGGDGTDGDLVLTSGATNIDLGGEAYVVKNYNSISITGTASLTFSNPHTNGTTIVIKSKGDVTLTSSATPMIDASGMGAAGGAAVSTSTAADVNGNPGSIGVSAGLFNTNFGGGGLNTTNSSPGAVPTTIAITAAKYSVLSTALKYGHLFVGAGGGSGFAQGVNSGTNTSGVGGRGGACLIIECAGSWNFTTAGGISVAGKNGGNATSVGGTNTVVAGGGGGAAGMFLGLYNDLIANTGTITVSGGTGGTALLGGAGGGNVSGGAGGASALNAGTASTAAGNPTGGTGGAGTGSTFKNTTYA